MRVNHRATSFRGGFVAKVRGLRSFTNMYLTQKSVSH